MAYTAVATNLASATEVLTTASFTSAAITPTDGALGTQAWLHITATFSVIPAGNKMIRVKICPIKGATTFDNGPDIPFTVSAATTYNTPIMIPQLSQSFKVVITNDTSQTATITADIEYIEAS